MSDRSAIAMIPAYDPVFVTLSVIVAILASFAALDLAGRVRSESGRARHGWVAGGGVVMGLGIWSMHFIGMLAFHLPVPIWYDVPLMLLSVLVAIGASLLALIIVTRPRVAVSTFIPGGIAMGFAIAGMHYIGMASLRTAATVSYSIPIVLASIAIAVVASLTALALAFRFRTDLTARGRLLKILSASVMGAAIAGMHYTAMAAARFVPGHAMGETTLALDATGELGAAVAGSTILAIILALIGAVIDRNIQSRTAFAAAQLAERTASLAKREEQYRTIVDTALDAVITMSSAGLITDWNPQAEKLFGWTRKEAIGRRMSETIIPQRYRDAHERGLEKFFATGEGPVLNSRIEISAVRRDGAEFPVELAISPAQVGTDWTFSAFIRDLTDRNVAAEAVRAGEQRYRELFEDIPVGLYRSTPDGQLVDVNPMMTAMLGYPDRESLLRTPAIDLYVDPTDRDRWTAEMRRSGFVRNFDIRMRRLDGTLIWARETTHAKQIADGTIVLFEGAIEDISERVAAEQRLRASEEQLRQALKMEAVGQLAGGVAHDFNNLLTVILSYSSMLLERIGPDDANRNDVSEIATAADRAAGLTRQLLAFGRQQVMNPRVLSINTVISDLENILRRLAGEDVDFRMRLDPTVAPIQADPGQLEQVLMNLVVNARDAMPSGGRLTITTSNAASSESRDWILPVSCQGEFVVLTVADTGSGMTPEVHQRLFDPFFTTKEPGRGTGLGLSTVYGIVKQSGGEIVAESELGVGSTFRACFPAIRAAAQERSGVATATDVPRGTESILLVEDEDILRALGERVLKRYGYTVVPARNGADAIAKAADDAITLHAVVTDVVMPGMNGREVAEKLTQMRPGLKILFMSGYTDDDVIRRGVQGGDAAFLQKPFTPADLARKIREVLDAVSAD